MAEFRADVEIELRSVEDGGRSLPVSLGGPHPGKYRPHLRVIGGSGDLLGVVFINGPDQPVSPGVKTHATIKALYEPEVSYAELKDGVHFQIIEGTRIVGHGRVLHTLPTGGEQYAARTAIDKSLKRRLKKIEAASELNRQRMHPKHAPPGSEERNQRVLAQLDMIESEMKRIGFWTENPPDLLAQVAAGTIKSYLDAPSFELWLQCVFLPNTRCRARENTLPRSSNVGLMGLRQYDYHSYFPEAERLLSLLHEFDRILL